jgi:hypothetical protein
MKAVQFSSIKRRVVLVSILALAVAGGTLGLVAGTGGGSSARAEASAEQAPPAWLQSLVEVVANGYATAPVATAEYTLTTNARLHDALPDLGAVDPASASKQFYVVVLRGAFASSRHPLGAEAASGPFLVLAIDAQTKSTSMLGIVGAIPNAAALGSMSPIAVAATTSE